MEKIEEALTNTDYPLVTGFLPPLDKEIPRKRERSLLDDRKSFAKGELHQIKMDSMDDLLDEGVNKVFYSSFYWEAVQQDHVLTEYPGAASYNEFLEDLDLSGKEEWRINPSGGGVDFNAENIYAPTFSLWRWQRPGPEIRFYDLPTEVSQ